MVARHGNGIDAGFGFRIVEFYLFELIGAPQPRSVKFESATILSSPADATGYIL